MRSLTLLRNLTDERPSLVAPRRAPWLVPELAWSAPPGRRRWHVAGMSLVVAALAVPLALGFAALMGEGTVYVSSDWAVLELATRNATRLAQLVGPYSRFGWNHPGPTYLYLLAVPYALLGSSSLSLAAGSLVLNWASAVAIVSIAWRRGGRWLGAWATLVVLFAVAALHPGLLHDPWNPRAMALPFALFVVVCGTLATGSGWSLLAVAGLATFLVQTHVSVVPVVAALLAGAFFARRRFGDRAPYGALPVLATSALLSLLWSPPLIDQLREPEGNLAALLSFFFLDGGGETHSLGDATRAVMAALSTMPLQHDVQGYAPDTWRDGWAAVALIALGTAAIVIGRRRDRGGFGSVLCGLSLLVLPAAVLGGLRVRGPIHDYLVLWLTTLPVALLLGVGAVAIEAGRRIWRDVRAATAALVVLSCVVVGGLVSVTTASMPSVRTEQITEVASLWPPLSKAVAPTEPVLVRIGSHTQWAAAAGFVLQLQRRGQAATVEAHWASVFGKQHLATGAERVVVEVWDAADPALTTRKEGREVARSGSVVLRVSSVSRAAPGSSATPRPRRPPAG